MPAQSPSLDDDDIYIMMQCLFVTKNEHLLVSMVFLGSFMVFHGFWLVSMVFQGSFMVFGWFFMIYKVVSWFFMVFGWFP